MTVLKMIENALWHIVCPYQIIRSYTNILDLSTRQRDIGLEIIMFILIAIYIIVINAKRKEIRVTQ